MSTRKVQLLSAVVEYLAKHGVARVSLRPLAAAVGTSARLLIFHFGSKEQLIEEAIAEVHARLQASFVSMVDTAPDRIAPLKRFWDWATRPENMPYLRLLYEVQIVAPDLAHASADWLALAEQAMSESARNKTMATLCIAVFDGLFLEFLSTGDHERTTRALDRFVAIAAAARGSPPSPPARRRSTAASSAARAGLSRSKRS